MPNLAQRFRAHCAATTNARFDEPPIEAGCFADYLALHAHHYRPGRPRTMPRIFVIRDPRPTVSDRYLARPVEPRPIAVLVESLPSLSCRMREAALGGRYGHFRSKPRSALLNDELRCISRVVVDPRWRGLGLAVRLVRHALATADTRYTEAIAVMGRVSPFFERAGMTAYRRPPLPTDERSLAALLYAGIEAQRLALPQEMAKDIKALGTPQRTLLLHELTRWYRTAGGRGVSRHPDLPSILYAAQQRLLAQPIYYLHENTHAPTQKRWAGHAADRSA